MTTIMPPDPLNSMGGYAVDPLRSTSANSSSARQSSRMIRLSAIALAFVSVVALAVILFSSTKQPVDPASVPVVAAETDTFREKPEDAGGMAVANRDSTVFDAQQNQPAHSGQIEQLIPEPEQPILDAHQDNADLPAPRRMDGHPALTAEEIRQMHIARRQNSDAAAQALEQLDTSSSQSNDSTSVAPPADDNEEPTAMNNEGTGESVEDESPAASTQEVEAMPSKASVPSPVTAQKSLESAEKTISNAPSKTGTSAAVTPSSSASVKPSAAKPVPAKSASAASAPVVPSSNASTKMVQLGAVRTEDAAHAELSKLKGKYASQLGSLGSSVQKADLGSRGVFWRMRAGPLNESDAKKVCASLTASGQSCMVVSR